MCITAHYFSHFEICPHQQTQLHFYHPWNLTWISMQLLSSFLFKLIFSLTYAHYSTFIKNVNSHTSYLFVCIQKHPSVGFILKNHRKTVVAGSLFWWSYKLLNMCFPVSSVKLRISILEKSYERLLLNIESIFSFSCQNIYLPLNSDNLLGKQHTMLRYGSQPSKISFLRFGDVFYFLPM